MDDSSDKSQPVDFAPRLIASEGFNTLYTEGMGLIEEVAAYLDGDGRAQSKNLSREGSFIYATESMRLTTRLMQLASWLLLQRAVNEGEISAENARAEKSKVKFSATPSERGGPGWEDLPASLLHYVEQGDRLFDRVKSFDALDRGHAPAETNQGDGDNDLANQMARLQAAFVPKSE